MPWPNSQGGGRTTVMLPGFCSDLPAHPPASSSATVRPDLEMRLFFAKKCWGNLDLRSLKWGWARHDTMMMPHCLMLFWGSSFWVLFCSCKDWHNMRQGRGNLRLRSLKMRLGEALVLQIPHCLILFWGSSFWVLFCSCKEWHNIRNLIISCKTMHTYMWGASHRAPHVAPHFWLLLMHLRISSRIKKMDFLPQTSIFWASWGAFSPPRGRGASQCASNSIKVSTGIRKFYTTTTAGLDSQ